MKRKGRKRQQSDKETVRVGTTRVFKLSQKQIEEFRRSVTSSQPEYGRKLTLDDTEGA